MSDSKERVKRHRASRKFIRVEVEVPSQDDAAAVRRFAQERKRHPARLHPPAPLPGEEQAAGSETLKVILPTLSAEALEAMRIFAVGLQQGQTPGLIARALRVASNFRDAAEMQSKAARILDTGNAGGQ